MKGARRGRRSAVCPAGMIAIAAAFCVGCGGPPRSNTTFLRSVDLVEMTDRMALSFAGDELFAARSPASDRWVISMNRITNHTNEIIPDREKWLYMGRLRAVLAQSQLAVERNLLWIIPPERWSIVASELGDAAPIEIRESPTHLLSAEFLALTNTSGRGRSDAYLCDYQLVDLATGQIVWEDRWEVKRAARGLTYD